MKVKAYKLFSYIAYQGHLTLGHVVSPKNNLEELKLNGTHQHLFFVYDVNLLEDNIITRKKNTKTQLDASRAVGLEVNTEKTNYTGCSWKVHTDFGHRFQIPKQEKMGKYYVSGHYTSSCLYLKT
jgi:hypothetical protein